MCSFMYKYWQQMQCQPRFSSQLSINNTSLTLAALSENSDITDMHVCKKGVTCFGNVAVIQT